MREAVTPSNWAESMRALEPEFVCPACGEQNSPQLLTNKIRVVDARGQVACSNCGHGGPLRLFQREK